MPFAVLADSVIVTCPVGLGLGRLGNFINGELFGRPSNVPWAMIFPAGGPIAASSDTALRIICRRGAAFHHNVEFAKKTL